ncbi:MAG: VOC family protein [Lactovum sp.]
MLTDLTVILYVDDVAASSIFWEQLGGEEFLRQDLGNGHTMVYLTFQEIGAGVQLYSKDFIRLTQPELLMSKPSFVFSADFIDDIYQNLKTKGYTVTEPNAYGEKYFFTFTDLDKNTFTIFGDYMDHPATEDELAEFDRNIRNLIPINFVSLEELSRPSYVFFGRKTCPWTRQMAKNFPGLKVPMYFVDTEGTDAIHPSRRKYDVKTVPTLIKRASNGMYVKFDKERESFSEFVG